MSLISNVLGGIWGYVAAAVIAAGLATAGTYYVVHNVDVVKLQAVQIADSKAQTASISASLAQLQGFIGTMHAADADYGAELDAINAQFKNLKLELHNATLKPLPADCKPDAGRVRVLSDAIAAANAHTAAGK